MGGKEEIRFAVIWQENRQRVSVSVCVCIVRCASRGFFVYHLLMTSATRHLLFLERVVDQPVSTCDQNDPKWQYIIFWLCSVVSSALNTSKGPTGLRLKKKKSCPFVILALLLLPHVGIIKWVPPFKAMASLCLYGVTTCTVATRPERYH